jgi:hypothetical protein
MRAGRFVDAGDPLDQLVRWSEVTRLRVDLLRRTARSWRPTRPSGKWPKPKRCQDSAPSPCPPGSTFTFCPPPKTRGSPALTASSPSDRRRTTRRANADQRGARTSWPRRPPNALFVCHLGWSPIASGWVRWFGARSPKERLTGVSPGASRPDLRRRERAITGHRRDRRFGASRPTPGGQRRLSFS